MGSAQMARVWLNVTMLGFAGVWATACGDVHHGTDALDAAINPGFGGSTSGSGLGGGDAAAIDAGRVADASVSNAVPGGGAAGAGLDAGSAGGSATLGGLTAGGFLAGGFLAGGFTGGGFPGGSALDAGNHDAGSGTGSSGSSDAGLVTDGGDPYAELRQLCVDTINMYRATVGAPALTRGNAQQEACSDKGAKYDGDMNVGHASANAGLCTSVGLPGIQDACPGWPVGGFGGNATLADALKKCLAQMWAEGSPPEGVAKCKSDFLSRTDITCFETHGHWINMSGTGNTAVSCGFYQMTNGSYWMNQDFVGR